MMAGAAPAPGRRVSIGAAAVLVGFLLLAPPLYLLGPFALLTLLSRPRTPREFFWLAAAALGVAASLSGPVALGPALLRASGLVVTGVFVLLSLSARGPTVPRALLAVALSAVGLALWARSLGIDWAGMEEALTVMLRESYQAMVNLSGPDPASRQDVQKFVQPFLEAAPGVARMMPGLLAVEAIGGLALAWGWHHRIAVVPIGRPPAPFRVFRFNDHLVWGAIFTLAVFLMQFAPPIAAVAGNVLIVWVGLYAARGLAIIATVLVPAPASLKLFAAALAFLLFPLTLGSLVAMGLADTWLDIRGRLTPPAPGGA
jgi:hypothetical protein